MSAFSIDSINNMCLDLLKEIGNIGSGNAATSLSQMINMKVDMQVPNIEVKWWICSMILKKSQ